MADFTRASLRSVSFRDSTLSDAIFTKADVWAADFAGAIGLDRVLNFDPSDALNADAALVDPSTWARAGQGARSQSMSFSSSSQC